MTISPLSGGARQTFLPGFVLLGDAAGFTDPLTGGGMTHALLAAELLAKHVAHQFGTGEAWLPVFDRERRSLLRDFQLMTHMMVMLTSQPLWMGAVIRGLRFSPALFSRLVGISAGVCRLCGGEHAPPGRSALGGYPSLCNFVENRADSYEIAGL
jgi:flavin-dependent dehydrogenase